MLKWTVIGVPRACLMYLGILVCSGVKRVLCRVLAVARAGTCWHVLLPVLCAHVVAWSLYLMCAHVSRWY